MSRRQIPVPSILRPLGLTQMLAPPERGLDTTPLFDVLLIIAMFFVLGSRFVFAPGLSISLPEAPEQNLESVPTVDVMTVKGNNFIIYQETKYSLAALEQALIQPGITPPPEGAILLVRADETVNMQTFIAISQLARSAGYSGVQLAAREPSEAIGPEFDTEIDSKPLFP